MSFLFALACLVAVVSGDPESGVCHNDIDGSSSCSATGDHSSFLQSRLGVAGDEIAAKHYLIEAAGDITKKPISPLDTCGQTYYILGESDVWGGNCFCYKLVMCDTLYQHQPTVDSCEEMSNEKCATAYKDWTPEDAKGFWSPLGTDDYWNTVIGKYAEDSEDKMTQSYTNGTKGSCDTKDEQRISALTVVADNSKEKLSVEVTEPHRRCSYKVKVSGPLHKLVPKTTTTTTTTTTVTDGPIPPSRSCGQTYYILGESDVQNGNCFCYKLIMCDTLYQHQPTVDSCEEMSNEKCATAYKDWTPEDAKGFWPPLGTDDYWNTVIGKYAEDSEDKMTQSYTNGTKGSCDTKDEKRKTALTMVADNSKKDLSVSVLEPDIRCSYKVKVSGPISKLLGLQGN